MKKYLLSFGVIVAFALYVVLNNQGSSAINPAGSSSSAVAAAGTEQAPAGGSGGAGEGGGSGPATPAPAPAPTPSPAPIAASGAFKNGSYTGPVTDAFYGPVQVQAIVQGGALADVKVLQEPSDNGHSQEVSAYALPVLVQEAIQAQSANVNIVSGATQTSDAFAQSLAAALAQAKS